jgi:hypothetical protein
VRRSGFAGIGAAAVIALAVSHMGAAAPERDQVIRMGTAIGKVQLGMTRPAVRRALGRRHAVVYMQRNFGARGRYIELGWELPGRTSWEPSIWQIGFRSWTRRGTLRVVRVIMDAPSQRTPQGFGVGTRSRTVVRAYAGATCVSRYGSPHPGRWIVVEGPRGGMTAFHVDDKERGFAPGPYFVIRVMVQRDWFSKGGPPFHENCRGDWENQ